MTSETKIPPIALTDDERTALEQLAQTDTNPTVAWRARAVLLLDQGMCSAHVARQVGVTKQCMSMFVAHCVATANMPVAERVQPSPGKPQGAMYKIKFQKVSSEIMTLWTQPPSAYGFDSPYWTMALLMIQISRNLDMPITYGVIQPALKRLGYSLRELRKGRPTPTPR